MVQAQAPQPVDTVALQPEVMVVLWPLQAREVTVVHLKVVTVANNNLATVLLLPHNRLADTADKRPAQATALNSNLVDTVVHLPVDTEQPQLAKLALVTANNPAEAHTVALAVPSQAVTEVPKNLDTVEPSNQATEALRSLVTAQLLPQLLAVTAVPPKAVTVQEAELLLVATEANNQAVTDPQERTTHQSSQS